MSLVINGTLQSLTLSQTHFNHVLRRVLSMSLANRGLYLPVKQQRLYVSRFTYESDTPDPKRGGGVPLPKSSQEAFIALVLCVSRTRYTISTSKIDY